jgi:hypothetical protein
MKVPVELNYDWEGYIRKFIEHKEEYSIKNLDLINFCANSTIKNIRDHKYPVCSLMYKANLTTTRYCAVSSFSKGEKSNCASFVQRLFKSVIKCSLFRSKYLRTDRIVSNPNYCRQRFKKSPLRKCDPKSSSEA